MLHVVTGMPKKLLPKNNTLLLDKLYTNVMWYFHHCSYIGLMCISQNDMNAIILHNNNARLVTLVNILITS